MREMADLLDELSDTIAQIYADRTGKPASQWRTAMQATTWYSATEAVQSGLADRMAGQPDTPTDSLKSQLIRARARARVALERVRMNNDEILAAMQGIIDGAAGRSLNEDEIANYEKLEVQLQDTNRSNEISARHKAYTTPVSVCAACRNP